MRFHVRLHSYSLVALCLLASVISSVSARPYEVRAWKGYYGYAYGLAYHNLDEMFANFEKDGWEVHAVVWNNQKVCLDPCAICTLYNPVDPRHFAAVANDNGPGIIVSRRDPQMWIYHMYPSPSHTITNVFTWSLYKCAKCQGAPGDYYNGAWGYAPVVYACDSDNVPFWLWGSKWGTGMSPQFNEDTHTINGVDNLPDWNQFLPNGAIPDGENKNGEWEWDGENEPKWAWTPGKEPQMDRDTLDGYLSTMAGMLADQSDFNNNQLSPAIAGVNDKLTAANDSLGGLNDKAAAANSALGDVNNNLNTLNNTVNTVNNQMTTVNNNISSGNSALGGIAGGLNNANNSLGALPGNILGGLSPYFNDMLATANLQSSQLSDLGAKLDRIGDNTTPEPPEEEPPEEEIDLSGIESRLDAIKGDTAALNDKAVSRNAALNNVKENTQEIKDMLSGMGGAVDETDVPASEADTEFEEAVTQNEARNTSLADKVGETVNVMVSGGASRLTNVRSLHALTTGSWASLSRTPIPDYEDSITFGGGCASVTVPLVVKMSAGNSFFAKIRAVEVVMLWVYFAYRMMALFAAASNVGKGQS